MPLADPHEVAFATVAPLARRASADRVSISDTGNTRWYVILGGGRIEAVAGLIRVGSGARIKGVWVEPACRGRGIGAHLVDFLLRVADQACCSSVEALAYNPAFYEARNFRRLGVKPNGAVRLRLIL